jgi:hypothetical protein
MDCIAEIHYTIYSVTCNSRDTIYRYYGWHRTCNRYNHLTGVGVQVVCTYVHMCIHIRYNHLAGVGVQAPLLKARTRLTLKGVGRGRPPTEQGKGRGALCGISSVGREKKILNICQHSGDGDPREEPRSEKVTAGSRLYGNGWTS